MLSAESFSQNKNSGNRILFLLDASGSMNEQWGKEKKFFSAKKVIAQILDSLANSGKTEVAIRIFGHQFPKKDENCTDTKLEIPFGYHSSATFGKLLATIAPKGYTPIALSLNEAIKDFGKSDKNNIIILITDGVENCEGDPCEASKNLASAGIYLKPYIVGLGLSEAQKKIFDCVGEVFDIKEEKSTQVVTNIVINNVLNPTSLQINLLDDYGKASETNVNMSFSDASNKINKYNIYHTLTTNNLPDTLFIDPSTTYDLKVHTIPPVQKKGIKMVTGKHTIDAVESGQGGIKINFTGVNSSFTPTVRVRKKGEAKSLFYQRINQVQLYRTGTYSIEIFTLPIIRIDSVQVNQSKVTTFQYPAPGNLNCTMAQAGMLTISRVLPNGTYEKIFSNELRTNKEFIQLQPGNYIATYRSKNTNSTINTRENKFSISSGATVTIKF